MSSLPRISIITSIYKGQIFIPSFFENVISQSAFETCELIIIHNQPNLEEVELIESFRSQHSEQVRYESIHNVEPLGASWNRGWRMARGEFITFWNVDDRRTVNSLELQVQALNQNPTCCMAYGDFVISPKVGGPEGWLNVTIEFERRKFLRRMVMGGAFMVFRKDIISQCGFFDEQLHSAMDFDFYLRLLHMGEIFCRVPGLMGYFTDTQKGLSTYQGGQLSHIEMNVVQKRYGIQDKIKWELIRESNRYRYDQYFFNNEWHPVINWVKDFGKPLLPWPVVWFSSFSRNIIRLLLMKLGIWHEFLIAKDKFLRRVKKH